MLICQINILLHPLRDIDNKAEGGGESGARNRKVVNHLDEGMGRNDGLFARNFAPVFP